MLLINNTPISDFNASLMQGSLKSVLSYPPIKNIPKNDWAEENGSEYDVSALCLDKKEVVLYLLISENKLNNFINFISEENIKSYEFQALKLTFLLRFIGFSKVGYCNGWIEIAVKFSDDTGRLPNHQSVHLSSYEQEIYINQKPLSSYGITLLQGSKEQIISKGNAKKTWEVTNSITSGVHSEIQPIKFEERTAIIKCFIYEKVADFVNGYYSFLADMLQPKINTLTYEGKNYAFLYKDGNITDFYIDEGIVWAEFDVQLILIE